MIWSLVSTTTNAKDTPNHDSRHFPSCIISWQMTQISWTFLLLLLLWSSVIIIVNRSSIIITVIQCFLFPSLLIRYLHSVSLLLATRRALPVAATPKESEVVLYKPHGLEYSYHPCKYQNVIMIHLASIDMWASGLKQKKKKIFDNSQILYEY